MYHFRVCYMILDKLRASPPLSPDNYMKQTLDDYGMPYDDDDDDSDHDSDESCST